MAKIRIRDWGIYFLAPVKPDKCQYGENLACNNAGLHCIKIFNDRDIVTEEYSNICPSHLLMVVIERIMH